MIKFEKVSYEQFERDCNENGFKCNREIYDNIKLPKRSDKGSAGYDFVSPFEIDLTDNKIVSGVIPTGIKACMENNLVLLMFPRSGLGFKTGMSLANTIGVVDASYYNNSSNEGHIMAKFVRGFKDLHISSGDRIMQGVFMQYFITDNDQTDGVRLGGLGSSGK